MLSLIAVLVLSVPVHAQEIAAMDIVPPSNPFAPVEPRGTVLLADEALGAAKEVAKSIQKMLSLDREPELIACCITAAASTPSYKLLFRQWKSPICVSRPWRVYAWMYDLQDAGNCECEGLSEMMLPHMPSQRFGENL